MTTDFAGGDIGDRSTFSSSSTPVTQPDTKGVCTCEGTYAVTFCKDCGIGMDTQAQLLAKVDEAIKAYEGYNSNLMPFLRTLRKAIEFHAIHEPCCPTDTYSSCCRDCPPDGYCLKCRVSSPCPELTEIAKEMGK